MIKISDRYKTISKVMRKIMCNTRNEKSPIQDKLEKLRKGRNKQMKSCSTESRLTKRNCKNLMSKKGKSKTKITKRLRKKKTKTKNQKRTTRKRNQKQCFSISSENFEPMTSNQLNPKLSHIHIGPAEYENTVEGKPDVDPCLSIQSIKPHRTQRLTDLDGLKFCLNKNQDGSSTEVTFETKLVMHFKQTPPSGGGDESVPKYINVNQLSDFLTDIRANSARGLHRTESTSLLRYAIHNDRLQSQMTILPVSGQNSLQTSQQTIPCPVSDSMSSPGSIKEVMSPVQIKDSSVLLHFGRDS